MVQGCFVYLCFQRWPTFKFLACLNLSQAIVLMGAFHELSASFHFLTLSHDSGVILLETISCKMLQHSFGLSALAVFNLTKASYVTHCDLRLPGFGNLYSAHFALTTKHMSCLPTSKFLQVAPHAKQHLKDSQLTLLRNYNKKVYPQVAVPTAIPQNPTSVAAHMNHVKSTHPPTDCQLTGKVMRTFSDSQPSMFDGPAIGQNQ